MQPYSFGSGGGEPFDPERFDPAGFEPEEFGSLDEELDAALGVKSPTEWVAIVDVQVLLRRGTQVLLLLRANTGFGDGSWSPPCGRLRPWESVVARAVREAREAVAVGLRPDQLRFAHVAHYRSNTERVVFFFEAWSWSGAPMNAEPHEHARLDWFPIGRLPEPTLPCSAAGIAHVQRGQVFSLVNWDY